MSGCTSGAAVRFTDITTRLFGNSLKLTIGIPGQPWYLHRPLPPGERQSINRKEFMSQHRSLRAAATLGGKRNVLKRFERTELLKKRGQWKDGDRITGLRKTKPEA
jgi:small basic protein (TIGR04137 family)